MKTLSVQNNLIIYKNKISCIFEIAPINIFLLSTEELISFYKNLDTIINAISKQVQIIVRTENEKVQDYEKYFKSINHKTENIFKNKLIDSHITDIKESINIYQNSIFQKRIYLIFSEEIYSSKIEPSLKKLNDQITRVLPNLNELGMSTRLLTSKNIISYLRNLDHEY